MALLRPVHRARHHRRPLTAGTSRRRRPDPQLSRPQGQPGERLRRGPGGSPYLYSKDDAAKLLLSPSGQDVPRNHEGIALIGDPRNDVHLFTSQMVVAFIKLHNRLVDRIRQDDAAGQDVFEQARRAASWHYQHVILREFLPAGRRPDRR
jgi:Animal haem peroxidase